MKRAVDKKIFNKIKTFTVSPGSKAPNVKGFDVSQSVRHNKVVRTNKKTSEVSSIFTASFNVENFPILFRQKSLCTKWRSVSTYGRKFCKTIT